MKGYLLDTNITDAVVAELLFGAYYSDRVEDNLRQVENFVSEMKVIPFHETVHAFAQERTTLWKAGKKIDDFDLLIGSAAKVKDLVVVTHNRKHFEHIDGIEIVDWV